MVNLKLKWKKEGVGFLFWVLTQLDALLLEFPGSTKPGNKECLSFFFFFSYPRPIWSLGLPFYSVSNYLETFVVTQFRTNHICHR